MSRIQILIVDDDEEDIWVFKDAVKDVNPNVDCVEALDCHEGLELLNAGLNPDYIFLDLNTPRLNGFQCLTELKKQARLKDIPTVIYTTSSQKADSEKALKLGANGFVVKPRDYSELKRIIGYTLSQRWDLLAQNTQKRIGH